MIARPLLRTGLLLAASCVLVACSGVASPTASTISFAEMQALNPGVDGEWILSEYPDAREVARGPNGRVASLGYWVNDPEGRARPLMLAFDRDGMLVRKQYGGPVVRPPPRGTNAGFGGP